MVSLSILGVLACISGGWYCYISFIQFQIGRDGKNQYKNDDTAGTAKIEIVIGNVNGNGATKSEYDEKSNFSYHRQWSQSAGGGSSIVASAPFAPEEPLRLCQYCQKPERRQEGEIFIKPQRFDPCGHSICGMCADSANWRGDWCRNCQIPIIRLIPTL